MRPNSKGTSLTILQSFKARRMTRASYACSAALKSKVALEAIKGTRSANEIASHYGVHPNQAGQWKKQALEHLQEAFSDGRKRAERADTELQNELYQQIGQLRVELDWVAQLRSRSHRRSGGGHLVRDAHNQDVHYWSSGDWASRSDEQ
jgi:transposase